jgi:hypothetical protein
MLPSAHRSTAGIPITSGCGSSFLTDEELNSASAEPTAEPIFFIFIDDGEMMISF